MIFSTNFMLWKPDSNSWLKETTRKSCLNSIENLLFKILPCRSSCPVRGPWENNNHDRLSQMTATWEVVRIQVVRSPKNTGEQALKQSYSTNMTNPSVDHWSPTSIIFNWIKHDYSVLFQFRSGVQLIKTPTKNRLFHIIFYFRFDRFSKNGSFWYIIRLLKYF